MTGADAIRAICIDAVATPPPDPPPSRRRAHEEAVLAETMTT
jgi:hypothetical protein